MMALLGVIDQIRSYIYIYPANDRWWIHRANVSLPTASEAPNDCGQLTAARKKKKNKEEDKKKMNIYASWTTVEWEPCCVPTIDGKDEKREEGEMSIH